MFIIFYKLFSEEKHNFRGALYVSGFLTIFNLFHTMDEGKKNKSAFVQ